jgi:hypothetical protein
LDRYGRPEDPVSHDLNSFHPFVRDELAFGNLSEPFIQAGQKLGFLRDLLEFRARTFCSSATISSELIFRS